MARLYTFKCDGCPKTEQRDSECLPEGWIILAIAGRSVDLCSATCLMKQVQHLEAAESPRQLKDARVRE